MKRIILLSVFLLAIKAYSIDRATQLVVDDSGLKHVYHGVNVVYKLPPFYPPISDHFDSQSSLSDEDLANLQSWGFNFIRLHIAWEGVEPVRSICDNNIQYLEQYNYTYLEQIKNIVERCEKFNIAVLLDAHQDVLSRFFCGEGFPDWAVSKSEWHFPYPLRKDMEFDEEDKPKIEDCLKTKFFKYYLTFDAAKAFDDFFHNANGVTDAFAEFWGVVAKYFAEVPNVLGYEIINEPLASSPYKSLYEFLYPNVGNNKNLLPVYQKVSKSIRENDKEKLLFFEPATSKIINLLTKTILADFLGNHFDDSPGGLNWRHKEVYSYHIYCPFVNSNSEPTNDLACKVADSIFFGRKEAAANHLGTAKFLTEFGAVIESDAGIKELNYILSMTESKFTSWAYWEFKFFADITTQAMPGNIESFYDEQGNLYEKKVKVLSRPYATAICGVPVQTLFDTQQANHYFVLDWKASNACQGKRTQLFLSQKFYFGNFKAHFKNCQGCTLTQVKGSYYEVVLPDNFKEGTQVVLSLIQV